MAKTFHERVGTALELLNRGLQPFVEREMQARHGEKGIQDEGGSSGSNNAPVAPETAPGTDSPGPPLLDATQTCATPARKIRAPVGAQ